MKKFLLIITILLFSTSAKAFSFYDDNIITDGGASITYDEYNYLKTKYNDELINRFDSNHINHFLNHDIQFENMYLITTYYYDVVGNLVAEYNAVTDRDLALETINNQNIRVDNTGRIVYTRDLTWSSYQTTSKEISGAYYKAYDQDNIQKYYILMYVSWFVLPQIKKYDVLAARWNTLNSSDYFYGTQVCDSNTMFSDYYLTTTPNVKSENYGLGVTMNLHDSAQTQIDLSYGIEDSNSFGNVVYGTYQHARNSNITMNGSLSYTFSSSGLGGVLYYSNSTIRNYYDGMQGIVMYYQDATN